jgi:hypothetical protein
VSGPEFLTPRERQLLAVVRELVDLPDPAPDPEPDSWLRHHDEIADRAAWLAGCLDFSGSPHSTFIGITRAIAERAARPLPYATEEVPADA